MIKTNIHKIIYTLLLITISGLITLSISSIAKAETASNTTDNLTSSTELAAAAPLNISLTASTGRSAAVLKDNSYSTKSTFSAGNSLTVECPDNMYGLYIEWGAVPSPYEITYNGNTMQCGTNGFLHEYISIPSGTTSAVITFADNTTMCDITAYSNGTLPDDVQVWQPPCEKADFLVLSTHADDEILFLGGVLAEYAGQEQLSVQVIYFSNYFNGTVIREHEKLDGLWVCGVRNYPVNGNFDDIYADSLASAEKTFDYDKTLSFVVENIRRFKPLICVTQDTNGEYGHGTHMLVSKAMQEAVTISMDSAKYPESAAAYGSYDVPKTYLHLYPEHTIQLDCRKSLNAFNGLTAIDVASAAYKMHVSQQWCWFYVSDTYEYSCSNFGLYRTTVGYDTGNDMLENITTYEKQAELMEQERLAQLARDEEARIALESSIAAQETAQTASASAHSSTIPLIIIILCSLLLLVIISFIIALLVHRLKSNSKK